MHCISDMSYITGCFRNRVVVLNIQRISAFHFNKCQCNIDSNNHTYDNECTKAVDMII